MLIALVCAACTGAGTATEPARTSGPPTTTTTTTASVVTSPATSTAPTTEMTSAPESTAEPGSLSSIYAQYATTETYYADLDTDVFAPSEKGAWPVVVTLHGGGWFAGDRNSMNLLADRLAGRGMVVFNPSYRTVALGGRFPTTVDDVACAVGHARETADRFTDTPDRVVVVGYSAGAHLGALVTLAPGQFGTECGDGTSLGVDAFVGLAGPYDTDLFDFLLAPWFGTDRADDPEPWKQGNPFTYVQLAPEVPVLLLHGDADQVVPPIFSESFAAALEDAGIPVQLELLSGAEHGTINDPRVVGDRIADFIQP